MSKYEPREWQVPTLRKFIQHTVREFLLEATPGAGKTMFSGFCAKELAAAGAVDFTVVVVPTTALKGDADAGFLGDWAKAGVQLTPVLREARDRPKEFAGGVVTYQQLPNIVSTFETWARAGVRLFVVFDEIHHASETNIWGAATERLARVAARVLGMTGTPFRADNQRISFVRYDDATGKAIPDHGYGYEEAVRDRICRELVFMTDDGVADYVLDGEAYNVQISESTEENAGPVAGAVFQRSSEWLRQAVTKADAKLDEYRIHDRDAGGIIICRAGTDDEDDKHVRQVARLVREITGENPEVITHDDPEANGRIERFRRGSERWICSVRKISEGVDIKRLRVQLLACKPGTELLFRQLVGRVCRHEDRDKPEDATVFMAKFPSLVEWARRIREEAEAGLRKSKERERAPGEREAGDYRPLGASHEDGGVIDYFGQTFAASEVDAAERLKRGDPVLSETSITVLVHVMRKLGAELPPEVDHGVPLHVEKKNLRAEINRLARRLAISLSPDQPDYKKLWLAIFRHTGVKNIDDLMDNHDIRVMRQVRDLLKSMLMSRGDAA